MELSLILIYVTSACVGGFIFLLGWVMKMNIAIGKCATYEWCEDKLVLKEVLETQLKSIEDSIKRIEIAVKKIANGHQ